MQELDTKTPKIRDAPADEAPKLSKAEISTYRWETHGLEHTRHMEKKQAREITWHKEIKENIHKDLLSK